MSNKFNPRCHIGETHGIYTIVDMLDKRASDGHLIYKSICTQCGRIKFSSYSGISSKSKLVTECKHNRVHGEAIIYGTIWNNKRLRKIFANMVGRCYNPNDEDYRWYGEKGVGIYGQWLSNPSEFEKWAISNGYTDNLTIDRIEADKDYCPENCRWIPLEDNSRRAGKVNWIDVDGVVLTGKQWSEKLGIGINAINRILKEYGINKTIELIRAMLQDLPATKEHKSNQNWFEVYGIQV
jgi:hypothetical protein